MIWNNAIFLLTVFIKLSFCEEDKISVTFVIDDTTSMKEDIQQVKSEITDIFDVVNSSENSQVEHFILVTFNDHACYDHAPEQLAKTLDRNEFVRQLTQIYPHGGCDCPEMCLSGIKFGLERSRPGSYLYVFTDAIAKDYNLLEEVRNLAIKKKAQIVFILSASLPVCIYGLEQPGYQVYQQLASATSGQIFHMEKNDVGEIMAYIRETLTKRKDPVASKSFPAGYGHELGIPVDGDMKELLIAGSGKEAKLDLTSPDGSKTDVEHVVDIKDAKVVKVVDLTSGNYTATVGSKSNTSLLVSAETGVTFKHGFSTVEPGSLNDTSTMPIEGVKSHVYIQLIGEDEVNLDKLQLVDLKENTLMEMPLKLYDAKQNLYVTDGKILPPGDLFRIAIKGLHVKSNTNITRSSRTPIEVQKVFPGTVKHMSPTMSIDKGALVTVKFNDPLKLVCSVKGYPKPNITWTEGTDKILPSEDTTVTLPYEHIASLDIEHVTKNMSLKCTASNTEGDVSRYIKVVLDNYFHILEKPKGTGIKYEEDGKIFCKVDSLPPAEITWIHQHKPLVKNDHFDISSDNTTLTVRNMQPEMDGYYYCRVRYVHNDTNIRFKINITGLVKPVIDKNKKYRYINVLEGASADINCKVIQGIPPPTLSWKYKGLNDEKLHLIEGNTSSIHMEKVSRDQSGSYRCIARNPMKSDTNIFYLTVEYPPTIEKIEEPITAKFKTKILLKCMTDGLPPPTVTWYRNGASTGIEKAYKMYHDNSLSFEVTPNTVGKYNCTATNKHGTASISRKVDYYVPIEIDIPLETKIETMVGEDVNLMCLADGYPEPTLKWLFYNSSSALGEPPKILRTASPDILMLKSVKLTDEGYYTCVASNKVPSQSNITYTIIVYEKPKIVYFDRNIFEAITGDRIVRLPCPSIGKPTPTITWVNGEGLNVPAGSEWYDIEKDGSLIIKNIDKGGVFKCVAENRFGSDHKIFHVVVHGYPRPSNPVSVFRTKVGEPAEVECPLPHTRVDNVRWYKDTNLVTSVEETQMLQFESLTGIDGGLYTCRVNPITGSAESATIKIIPVE